MTAGYAVDKRTSGIFNTNAKRITRKLSTWRTSENRAGTWEKREVWKAPFPLPLSRLTLYKRKVRFSRYAKICNNNRWTQGWLSCVNTMAAKSIRYSGDFGVRRRETARTRPRTRMRMRMRVWILRQKRYAHISLAFSTIDVWWFSWKEKQFATKNRWRFSLHFVPFLTWATSGYANFLTL